MSRSSASAPSRLQHLERAQAVTNTGSWEWDISTGALLWTDQIFRIFGYAPGAFEPTYPAFLDRIHPSDRASVEAAVARALRQEAEYAIEHRIVRPDGTIRVVHELGVVDFDRKGEALRMIGAVSDVTEARETEAAHREVQEMLGSLLRISPEAIIVTDDAANILLFSSGAESMFGYAAAEVIGRNIDVLLPLGLRARHQGHVSAFRSGEADSLRMHERGEVRGLRADGAEFPAEASLTRLSRRSGMVFAAVVRDLSAAKAAEQRLVDAREQAERASQAKSSFLANMSHEIRTPLNGVLGIASALSQTELTALQTEMVDLIALSGRALQTLLSDILDLARVEAGQIHLRAAPFDLLAMASQTCALFRASAAEKGLEIRLDAGSGLEGMFEGDDLRLRQVLSNLLSNAVKFTASGEIRVTISSIDPGATRIAFAVSDTGIGFDPAHADILFERFEQADATITRRFGGSGLGLAISKALVELMGGEIHASGRPGEGATFAFEVPLRTLPADQGGVPAAVGTLTPRSH